MGLCPALASGASAATSPCGADWGFTQPASSVWQHVTVPSLQFPLQTYEGLVVRPDPVPHGKQPAVVVMHGKGTAQCSVWWAARLLAAHTVTAQGYVTMTINNPTNSTWTPAQLIEHHVDAVKSAVHFLRSTSNPYASFTDTDHIGLVGHSLGAAAISYVQALNPFVKAIVGLDNIRAYHDGDAGAYIHCQQPPSGPVTARAPALGEASEAPCTTEGQHHPPPSNPFDFTDKRLAFKHWRANEVASMETVMNGFEHTTFAGLPQSDPVANAKHAEQLGRAGYYMQAWLDLWLRHDPTAPPRLLSCTPHGDPIDQVLSSKLPGLLDPPGAYQSSLFVPSIAINKDNLLSGCP
jgi:hypothetical protein